MPPRRRGSLGGGGANRQLDMVKEILLTPSHDRTEDDIRALQQATAENKFFNEQTSSTVHKECCKCLVLVCLQKEDVLFSQGDDGDAFLWSLFSPPTSIAEVAPRSRKQVVLGPLFFSIICMFEDLSLDTFAFFEIA